MKLDNDGLVPSTFSKVGFEMKQKFMLLLILYTASLFSPPVKSDCNIIQENQHTTIHRIGQKMFINDNKGFIMT